MSGLVVSFHAAMTEESAFINVMDFGAVGDGVKEDTNAFLKAISTSGNTGKQILVPSSHKFAIVNVPFTNNVHMALHGEIVNISSTSFSMVNVINVSIDGAKVRTRRLPGAVGSIGGNVLIENSKRIILRSLIASTLVASNSQDMTFSDVEATKLSLFAQCRSVTSRILIDSSHLQNVEMKTGENSTVMDVTFRSVHVGNDVFVSPDPQQGSIHNIYLDDTRFKRQAVRVFPTKNSSEHQCGYTRLAVDDESGFFNVIEQ